jgi:hypothetical protein
MMDFKKKDSRQLSFREVSCGRVAAHSRFPSARAWGETGPRYPDEQQRE